MTRFLIIINLCFALLLMPVAQAFATPLDMPQTTEGGEIEMTHCPEMSDTGCGNTDDCKARGMHCVDSINLAILYHFILPNAEPDSRIAAPVVDNYLPLFHLTILRPPRYS